MSDYEQGTGPIDDNVDVLRDEQGDIADEPATERLEDEQDAEQNEP